MRGEDGERGEPSRGGAPARTAEPADRWWRTTWPFTWSDLRRYGTPLAVVVAVGWLFGWLLTDALAPNAVTELDADVTEWFVAWRTPTRNDLAHWGALLADTPVKVGISALLVAAMALRWRRWHESALVAVSLVFEATAFIVITFLVGRPRPDVPRLLDSPVDSSFPSGHVAAATVYGALVVIVFWHTRSLVARSVAVLGAAGVVTAVAFGRLHQGMHYLSDVIAGVVLGLVSLAICVQLLGRPEDAVADEPDDAVADEPEPLPAAGAGEVAAPALAAPPAPHR